MPTPVAKNVVCSDCGLPWDTHKETLVPDAPSIVEPSECVRLLKAELVKRPVVQYATTGGSISTYPFGAV